MIFFQIACILYFSLSLSHSVLIVWNITWIDGRRGTHSLGHYNNDDDDSDDENHNNIKANATTEIKYTSMLILEI